MSPKQSQPSPSSLPIVSSMTDPFTEAVTLDISELYDAKKTATPTTLSDPEVSVVEEASYKPMWVVLFTVLLSSPFFLPIVSSLLSAGLCNPRTSCPTNILFSPISYTVITPLIDGLTNSLPVHYGGESTSTPMPPKLHDCPGPKDEKHLSIQLKFVFLYLLLAVGRPQSALLSTYEAKGLSLGMSTPTENTFLTYSGTLGKEGTPSVAMVLWSSSVSISGLRATPGPEAENTQCIQFVFEFLYLLVFSVRLGPAAGMIHLSSPPSPPCSAPPTWPPLC
jgi:hypothetical protein